MRSKKGGEKMHALNATRLPTPHTFKHDQPASGGQNLLHLARAADKAAMRAKSLGERAHAYVHPALHSLCFGHPTPPVAAHESRVGFVEA